MFARVQCMWDELVKQGAGFSVSLSLALPGVFFASLLWKDPSSSVVVRTASDTSTFHASFHTVRLLADSMHLVIANIITELVLTPTSIDWQGHARSR